MPPLINNQWEKFCLAYFSGKTKQDAAIEAGYPAKSAGAAASRLLRIVKISDRLRELQEKTASARVMEVTERKERLSEIARAKLPDYLTGSEPIINKDSPNAGAIEGYKVQTRFTQNGEPITTREIKLHSAIQAIAELNKMEGAYAPAQLDLTSGGKPLVPPVIQVVSPAAKALTEEIIKGKGTE